MKYLETTCGIKSLHKLAHLKLYQNQQTRILSNPNKGLRLAAYDPSLQPQVVQDRSIQNTGKYLPKIVKSKFSLVSFFPGQGEEGKELEERDWVN